MAAESTRSQSKSQSPAASPTPPTPPRPASAPADTALLSSGSADKDAPEQADKDLPTPTRNEGPTPPDKDIPPTTEDNASSAKKKGVSTSKSSSRRKDAPVEEQEENQGQDDGHRSEESGAKDTASDLRAIYSSYFTVEHREFMEDFYPEYLTYEARSKDKSRFLKNTAAKVLEVFPLEQYPLPPSLCKPLPFMTKDEKAALGPKARKNRNNAENRRKRTEEQRFVDVCVCLTITPKRSS
jgi:hypothetical protein